MRSHARIIRGMAWPVHQDEVALGFQELDPQEADKSHDTMVDRKPKRGHRKVGLERR